ncbi:MAG TPA: hypothetical protein VGF79_11290 [Bacteroidia bacterium]
MKVQKSIRMISEDILEITFDDNVFLDLEKIIQSFEETEAFTNGRKLKRLVISGKKTDITKEARAYGLKENERLKDQVIAEALVVHSFTQKMITNFYLKYINKSYPAKAFTDVEKAKEWLNTF